MTFIDTPTGADAAIDSAGIGAVALLAALPEPAVVARRDGRVVVVNPALVGLLGGAVPPTLDELFVGGVEGADGPEGPHTSFVLLDVPSGPVLHRAMITAIDRHHRLVRIERRLDRDAPVDGAERDELLVELATRRAAEERLLEMVSRDELTGVANRSALDRRLRNLVAAGHRPAVIYLDLDRFKAINDVYGHDAGDRAMITAATRLSRAVRPDDLVGRRGGDEFCVLLAGATRLQAVEIGERLCHELGRAFTIDGDYVDLSASIGIAHHRRGDDAATLVARADAAMYRAKRRGGACLELDDEGRDPSRAGP